MSLPPPLLRAYFGPGLELGEDIYDLTNPHSHLHLHFIDRQVEAKILRLGHQRLHRQTGAELGGLPPAPAGFIQAISQVPDIK